MQTLQTLNINGRQHTVAIDDGEMLVDVLRDKLGLTGAKKGCGQGDCGACTVLVDDKAVADRGIVVPAPCWSMTKP
jgi:carbon-monoxide dehydrogenase small subunit